MAHPALRVLYEDNHLLAVNKPALLATMGVPADRTSLVDLVKDYLKQKYGKPGNVFLGVTSRLDSPVTGVVLFARTSKAASRLSDQFRRRTVEKIYWALVERPLEPAADELVDWLKKHERHRKVLRANAETPEAQKAILRYATTKTVAGRTLLEIRLLTGRKHQIRVQLASRQRPIVGDRKYGSRQTFPQGIALHGRRLIVQHPISRDSLLITAPVPDYWPRFVAQLESGSPRTPPTSRT